MWSDAAVRRGRYLDIEITGPGAIGWRLTLDASMERQIRA